MEEKKGGGRRGEGGEGRGEKGKRRTKVRVAADSGAVDTVMKDEELGMHKKTESQKVMRGG